MKQTVVTERAYHVPMYFQNQDNVFRFLRECGFILPERHVGKLWYLLEKLYVEPIVKKDDNGGWVTINSKMIYSIIGKAYHPIMNKLVEYGFVKPLMNNGKASYQANKVSKQYRLEPPLLQQEWCGVSLNASRCSTTRKLIRYYYDKYQKVDYALHRLLTQVGIDHVDFLEETTVCNFLESSFTEQLTYLQAKAIKKLKRYKKIPENKLVEKMTRLYQRHKLSYTSVRDCTWRYKVDQHGRRHTNITNMPKTLREHLYVELEGVKHKLMEVDVSNSQVLLLLTLFDEKLKETVECKLFKTLVETGNFYQFLANKQHRNIDDCKDEIKHDYFMFVFGNPELAYIRATATYQIMEQYFLPIVQWLRNYKAKHYYEKPAQMMQKAESQIIISNVCAKAIKNGLFVTQVYDSILCIEEDLPTINKMVKEAFANKGLHATTNIDKANAISVQEVPMTSSQFNCISK